MRKIATAATAALVLALGPAPSAVAQSPTESAGGSVPATSVTLAQNGEEDDSSNAGLWGLLGLLGLLGLIPRKKKDNPDHRTRNTGM